MPSGQHVHNPLSQRAQGIPPRHVRPLVDHHLVELGIGQLLEEGRLNGDERRAKA